MVGARISVLALPVRSSAQPSLPGSGYSQMIVAIAQSKDREAFAVLFEHFAPRVKSYLTRLGTTPEVAEDLAQDCMLSVWRKAEAYDPARAAASTWIFTIARNLRIDGLRKLRRPVLTEDPCAIDTPATLQDAALQADEEQAVISRAIYDLPDDQADVIRLAFFSDKPHAMIAEDLGLPLGTVKSRLRLAMVRLRKSLGELA